MRQVVRARWVLTIGLLAPLLLASTEGTPTTEGAVTEFRPEGARGRLADAHELILGPDGLLWMTAPAGIGDHLGRISGTGDYTDIQIEPPQAEALTIGPDGAIWMVQWGGNLAAIGRITTDLEYTRTDLAGGQVLVDIVAGPDGRLWFSEFNPGVVGVIDPSSRAVEEFPFPPELGRPGVMASDPAGRGVWVATELNFLVLIGDHASVLEQITLDFGVTDIESVDGTLWLGGGTWNIVARLGQDDSITSWPVGNQAMQAAVDTRGLVWFTNNQANRDATIGRFDPATGEDTFFPLPSPFGSANVVALGPDDQIWFIESRFAEDPDNPGIGIDTIGRIETGAPIGQVQVEVPEVVAGPALIRIHRPSEVLEVDNVAYTGLIVLGLYLLLILPSTVFNSTLDANSERIMQWAPLRFLRGVGSVIRRLPGIAVFVLFVPIAALIYALPSLRQGGAAFPVAFSALTVALLVPAGLTLGVARRHLRASGIGVTINCLPEALPIAAVFALATLAAGFDALFAYGVVVGWAARRDPEASDLGRIAGQFGLGTLLVGLSAWLVLEFWTSASEVAGGTIAASLEAIFMVAVEVLLFGMIPARFLPGADLRRWSHAAHDALWLSGAVLFGLSIIGPGLDDFRVSSLVALASVAGGFALVTLLLWWSMARRTPIKSPAS
ncbi:MAG TPA: hypothetical protein VIA81_05625 [Acidimicrobiia bacterium]|jgi:streptogramin lyase